MKSQLVRSFILSLFLLASAPAAATKSIQTQLTANEFLFNKTNLSSNFKTESALQKAIKKTQKYSQTNPRNMVEQYRLAIAALKLNRADIALQILPTDENFKSAQLNTDRLHILRARALYQNKQYDAAIAEYSKIAKSSDLWVTAVEERAHTFGKQGAYENAIADFTTLFSPVFINFVSPESFSTAALTYLRICQYGKIYETVDLFKKQMRERITHLEGLASRLNDATIISATSQIQNKGYSSLSYAALASQLPQNFHLDYQIRDLLLQSPLKNAAISKRTAQLAQQDLQDIDLALNKMQLIEAEVMQRLHLVEQNKGNKRMRAGAFKKGKDQLQFPFNGEIWIDELDAYQVQTKECPSAGKGA